MLPWKAVENGEGLRFWHHKLRELQESKDDCWVCTRLQKPLLWTALSLVYFNWQCYRIFFAIPFNGSHAPPEWGDSGGLNLQTNDGIYSKATPSKTVDWIFFKSNAADLTKLQSLSEKKWLLFHDEQITVFFAKRVIVVQTPIWTARITKNVKIRHYTDSVFFLSTRTMKVPKSSKPTGWLWQQQ